MNCLLFFIAGIIFTKIFMPFVLTLLELFVTKCEVIKTNYTAQITDKQIEMEKKLAVIEELKTNTRVIGFGAPEEEYSDENVGEEPEDEN